MKQFFRPLQLFKASYFVLCIWPLPNSSSSNSSQRDSFPYFFSLLECQNNHHCIPRASLFLPASSLLPASLLLPPKPHALRQPSLPQPHGLLQQHPCGLTTCSPASELVPSPDAARQLAAALSPIGPQPRGL